LFVVKSWGLLKNFKIRSGSYIGLGLKICLKKGIKISLDCPFNPTIDQSAAGPQITISTKSPIIY
jgi:hypothetical protein